MSPIEPDHLLHRESAKHQVLMLRSVPLNNSDHRQISGLSPSARKGIVASSTRDTVCGTCTQAPKLSNRTSLKRLKRCALRIELNPHRWTAMVLESWGKKLHRNLARGSKRISQLQMRYDTCERMLGKETKEAERWGVETVGTRNQT
ncbi:hypothetical protein K456DRAFT_1110832 [Colletotrichum gloeosporioides 23]|nr:hypothetical protein K456DRAFT_1110832 [Colletotrichum gloeosporioides 23]